MSCGGEKMNVWSSIFLLVSGFVLFLLAVGVFVYTHYDNIFFYIVVLLLSYVFLEVGFFLLLKFSDGK